MTYDASDPKQVGEKAKEAKAAQSARVNFLVSAMSTREGRLWIRDLLESTKVFQTSFSPESLKMAFNEGERNIGLRILADVMTSCPDRYIEMMKENKDA